ncbi:cytochrome c oxidase subunit II [Thalassovita sp.]|uniref:cytochrome c oxidase subunit II n=1 Tax=Thalassovita sp. TaxID=1979401 RepID=UPI002881FDFF|nr:cytochrome c oxidase subunit II [Thalassovita sp.]MDF1804108.1 cytochrome c oxidase subunit II [Thalassovita sp.]
MKLNSSLLAAAAAFTAAPAFAQDVETVGKPHPGLMGFQPAATELARDLQSLDHLLLVIITAITLFVVALVAYIIVRHNRRANPTPATFTHNSPLEIAWTIIPIVILVFIGAFSLPVLFKQQEIPEGEIHIKVTGYQWYWGYEYTDHDFAFDSYMIGQPATMDEQDDEAGVQAYVRSDGMTAKLKRLGYAEDEFLLATDTQVVIPVNKVVVMDVTAADVIHSWTIPAFGVKQDAVPGRIAQLWFKAEKEGIYFGQCSELCGKDHAYMPITVKVVSEADYKKWLDGAIEEYAGTPRTLTVASAD